MKPTYNCYACNQYFESVKKPSNCPDCNAKLDYVFTDKVNNQKEEIYITEEKDEL